MNIKTKPFSIAARKRGKRFVQNKFSVAEQVNGVMWYLYDKGYVKRGEAIALINKYVTEKNIIFDNKKFLISSCAEIQKDFTAFSNWVKEQTKVA